MQTVFKGKRISALLGVLPEEESLFDDEIPNYDFPEKQTKRLKRVMGYDRHRIAKPESTVSDFGLLGLQYMLEHEWIRQEEIGAIIVVTLCPDHFVPHISTILQGKLGLDSDVICLDVAQGCCGFLIGLMECFMLLDHIDSGGDGVKKKAILVNGDVLSHKISRRDRNDFPLVGDATTLSIIENDPKAGEILYEMHMDGSQGDALIIPAGGFRTPCTSETAIVKDQGNGNHRALDNMHMDGKRVYDYVQNEIPPMIEHMLSETGKSIDDIDWFLCHQPNKFMLQKLADKCGIPWEKMPMNLVENYGNSSGASIPMTAILNLREELLMRSYRCLFSAFGSGLARGGMILDFGDLDFCEMLESAL